ISYHHFSSEKKRQDRFRFTEEKIEFASIQIQSSVRPSKEHESKSSADEDEVLCFYPDTRSRVSTLESKSSAIELQRSSEGIELSVAEVVHGREIISGGTAFLRALIRLAQFHSTQGRQSSLRSEVGVHHSRRREAAGIHRLIEATGALKLISKQVAAGHTSPSLLHLCEI
ncbi:hypothetical protein LINPERHAP1_LOCUS4558, partial [Linum perenne]